MVDLPTPQHRAPGGVIRWAVGSADGLTLPLVDDAGPVAGQRADWSGPVIGSVRDTSADDQPFIFDVLVGHYIELRRAWRAALLDREVERADAPWLAWRTGLDEESMVIRDVMIQVGELAGVNAARAVTQHLGLLARAYWLDPADPEDEASRWLGAAPFAPARAVMEGTAMTGWLLTLDPTRDYQPQPRP